MTMRRQALRSSATLATSFLLSLTLIFFFTLPSILVRAEPASSDISAATGEADLVTPLLPLTVMPKPDASPLAALKAPHDPSQHTTLLTLVLALLSAVTFLLWRYPRRDYASPRRIGRRI
jgi:hypothetical protein